MKEEGQDTVEELAQPKKLNKHRLAVFNDAKRSHALGAEDAGTVSHVRSIAQTQRSLISKKSKSISIHPPTTDNVWETKSTMPDRESVSKERQELNTLNKLTKQTLSKLNPGGAQSSKSKAALRSYRDQFSDVQSGIKSLIIEKRIMG